jgi:hypothetical protein
LAGMKGSFNWMLYSISWGRIGWNGAKGGNWTFSWGFQLKGVCKVLFSRIACVGVNRNLVFLKKFCLVLTLVTILAFRTSVFSWKHGSSHRAPA